VLQTSLNCSRGANEALFDHADPGTGGLSPAGTGGAEAASGDYIVMLRDGVSLQAHLKAQKITPNRVYQYAGNGYEALLNDTQYKRKVSSSDVAIITPNVTLPMTLDPMRVTSTPTQPPQSPTNGVKRFSRQRDPLRRESLDRLLGGAVFLVSPPLFLLRSLDPAPAFRCVLERHLAPTCRQLLLDGIELPLRLRLLHGRLSVDDGGGRHRVPAL
jgi:hypothetical protein